MASRAAVLLVFAAALLAAGGAGGYLLAREDDEEPTSEPPTTTPTVEPADGTPARVPSSWTLCTNESQGYAVAYPASWSAPALSAESECTFFDPEPIELPENSDFYGAALEVAPAQESFDGVVRGLTDPRFEETRSRREVTVAGRPAVRIESRATGEGLFERGLESVTYVVDRGERPPLVLRTFRTPGVRWEERQAVLDRAARSLVVFRPVEARAAGTTLPDAVERKRAAILAAAERHDFRALGELADPREFTYTYGGPVDGGPAEYWRRLEQDTSERPAETLAAILRLPYTLHRGIYVWPFAYDKQPSDLTAHERELLGELADDFSPGTGYLGWRAGIRPDGRWVFFVAGD